MYKLINGLISDAAIDEYIGTYFQNVHHATICKSSFNIKIKMYKYLYVPTANNIFCIKPQICIINILLFYSIYLCIKRIKLGK